MAVFQTETMLACRVEQVWEFLLQPANLVKVTAPELNLRLADGPERSHLGARITVVVQRMGISQRMVSEVIAFEPPTLVVDEQREGPFKKWVHTHQLEAAPDGTRMTDRIEFEPPGGLLGFVLTAHRIEQEMQSMFAFRARRFKELLEGRGSATQA